MKTTLVHRYPHMVSDKIEEALKLATTFMTARYGEKFNDLRVTFTTRAKTSIYDRDALKSRIVISDKWTHPKLKDELVLGRVFTLALCLVRHMTHHVQNIEKRISSEIEISKNEFDFLTEVSPDWNKSKVLAEATLQVNAAYRQLKKALK